MKLKDPTSIKAPQASFHHSVSKTEELAEQEEKNHSLILLSFSNEVLYEVGNEETASGLWLKLEKLYMTKSICNFI